MAEQTSRIERDSMGEVKVPKTAYYGAQTQRAVENFPVSGVGFPPSFIHALAIVKYAAAAVNEELGLLESRIAEAIRQAATEVMEGNSIRNSSWTFFKPAPEHRLTGMPTRFSPTAHWS
jgi:fumarate hydratase, class II